MTQLLVSVKNVQEAHLALSAGVSLIDLKDPAVGALGALDMTTTEQIVAAIGQRATVSATVGELHNSMESLLDAVDCRVRAGVHVIKVAVDHRFNQPQNWQRMQALMRAENALVAVIFADDMLDFNLVAELKQQGLSGVMLDTQSKRQSLFEMLPLSRLRQFADLCREYDMTFGLSGGVKTQDIAQLAPLEPTFIGMRGGMCVDGVRDGTLCSGKLVQALDLLQSDNKGARLARRISPFALRTTA